MKCHPNSVLFLLAAVFAIGCASTNVSDRQIDATGKLPRPDVILVYNFAATPGDVPDESALSGNIAQDAAQTPQQIEAGRQLGAKIARELTADIQAMGMPARAVPIGTPVPLNDIVIKGYLVSAQAGSEADRLVVGFGQGASQLTTVVEGFQMTTEGLRKLGSGEVESGGSKGPGAGLGVAGLIATGNPAGLIVSTGLNLYGEESGSSTLEGRAQATAQEIAAQIKPRLEQQGWIP